MASTQKFDGHFASKFHQFNGNNFQGPVFVHTPDSKARENSSAVQSDPQRKFAEQSRGEHNERSKYGPEEGLEWNDCFHSLEFEASDYREEAIDRHTNGTCVWILQSPEYLRWVNQYGLLLIRGKPGCGKSTLLKFILEKQIEATASSGVGLFRSLLLQLLDQDDSARSTFQDICRKRWTREGKKNKQLTWHRTELKNNLEKLILECSTGQKITIFVDAIDECRDQDRDDVIKFFHSLKDRLAVCLTCRLHPDGQIDEDFRIRLDDENQEDIKKFIERELRLPDENETAKDELKQLLRSKSDGMFLWLVLIIRQVHEMSSKGVNMKVIQSEISRCPKQLDGIYKGLLQAIEDSELLEAGRLFQWICFAARPLSVDELRIALTIHLSGPKHSLEEYRDECNPYYIPNEQKMKKRMIYLTRGLADVSNSKSAEGKTFVRFYHETIKEFMIKDGLQYLDSRLKRSQGFVVTANFQLANTCLDYLSTTNIRIAFSGTQMRSPTKFLFLHYTTMYWLDHAINAEKDGFGEEVKWSSQDALKIWVRTGSTIEQDSKQSPEEGTSLMHIAAEHGLERLAKHIIGESKQETKGLAQKSFTRTTPRSRINVSDSSVQESVKNGPRDNRQQSPMVISNIIRQNCYNSKGGSNSNISKAREQAKSPTKGSMRKVTGYQKVLGQQGNHKTGSGKQRLNIQNYIIVGMVTSNEKGCTAFYLASVNGHLEVVKFLYEHGADADIHASNKDGWTPLNAASSNGHLDVVKFLYEHGADSDIHTTSKNGWTLLNSTSDSSYLNIVKFLYEHGVDADIHTTNKGSWTPLNSASDNGHLDIVKFLYEHRANADIHVLNKDGWTPLNSASNNGHLDVVKFLYEHRADINIHTTSKNGWTPLNSASNSSHLDVVKFLYDHGADADIHTTDKNGWTPLNSALDSSHLDIVKFLYEHRADVDIRTTDNDGWTSLNTTSSNGYLNVVKFLYEHGVDVDIHVSNKDGWTPLNAASSNGHLDVAKFLYDYGADADIHISNKDGWTPLHTASVHGNHELVKFLCEYEAWRDIRRITYKNGWTPLHAASNAGHLDVVEFLYKHGAEIHAVDQKGSTPLYLASKSGHLEVVKFLCEHGANSDIHVVARNGWTPLYVAWSKSHLEVEKFLLEHGADIDVYAVITEGFPLLYLAP
ncbi:hypothetical protein B7463_g8022, partial [Scytalidium lignicola]